MALFLQVSLLMACNRETGEYSRPNILFIPVDDLRPELGWKQAVPEH